MKNSNNLVGVTGEYYVCAELGNQGLLALLTPKNNPLFDVVAVAPDASRVVAIQVKTMSKTNKQGWKLGIDICEKKNNPSLYTVLVDLRDDGVDYYVYEYDVLSDRVAAAYQEYISQPKRDGTNRKDIAFRWYDFKFFTEDDWSRKSNWGILGFNKQTEQS